MTKDDVSDLFGPTNYGQKCRIVEMWDCFVVIFIYFVTHTHVVLKDSNYSQCPE